MFSNLQFFNSWDDKQQVERLDKSLGSLLQYEGEFGPEIVTFLPFIFNLHIRGMLRNRIVSTYSGMEVYYYFLNPRELKLSSNSRFFLPQAERWWTNSNEHHRPRTTGENYPIFDRQQKLSKRPLLFIQNKYCVEWDREPINYLSLEIKKFIL